MYNHIVREPAAKIREIARDALRGYWKPMFIATLIYYLMTSGISSILTLIFSVDMTEAYQNAGFPIIANMGYSVDFGGSLYLFVVGGPFLLGFSTLLLTFFRTRKIDNSLNFEGFSFFTKAFLLQLLIGIKVFLWSLLFVLPGVVAYYRYSQAFYVLADNPDYTVRQCIEESKRLMYGNKANRFWLDMSFIGWAILAVLPGSLLEALLPNSAFATFIVMILTFVPNIILNEYVLTSQAAFYELATERLVVVPINPYERVEHQNQQNQQAQDFQQNQGWQQAPTNEEPSQNNEWPEQSVSTQPDVDGEPPIVDVEYNECPPDGSETTDEN